MEVRNSESAQGTASCSADSYIEAHVLRLARKAAAPRFLHEGSAGPGEVSLLTKNSCKAACGFYVMMFVLPTSARDAQGFLAARLV